LMSLTHPNSAGLLLPVLQLPAVAHELRTPAHYTQNTQSCSRLAAGPLGCGLDERGPFEGMTSYVTKTLRRVWSDHLATQSSLRRVTSNLGTFAEPNNPTTNSLSFRLTARRHGLGGNSQYRGKAPLSSLPVLPVGLPKSHRPGLSEVRVSESPPRGARLVNCAGVRLTKRALGHEFERTARRAPRGPRSGAASAPTRPVRRAVS
jgi:hypothetical protein